MIELRCAECWLCVTNTHRIEKGLWVLACVGRYTASARSRNSLLRMRSFSL